MRKKEAVSLIELIVALCMITVMVLTIGSVGNSLYAMKRDIIDRQLSTVQGNLAMSTIFERILRGTETTGPGGGSVVLDISPDGTSVSYKRFSLEEKIWKDADKIKATQSKIGAGGVRETVAETTILTNVASLKFNRDVKVPAPAAGSGIDPLNNRLNIEVVLKDEVGESGEILKKGETFRTCVQPRNEFTPIGLID